MKKTNTLLVAMAATLLTRRQVLHLAAGCSALAAAPEMAWAQDYPHLYLPLPEPWRAGPFAAALRRAGVLVRTMDHFAVGRMPTPHAIRISLNKPKETLLCKLKLK